MEEPQIIQGGMGVGVSGWRLARAVSQAGQLGVVSGTALDIVFVRRLQLGDVGGHLRRALALFPAPELVEEVLDAYFIPGGKSPETPFVALPLYTSNPSLARQRLAVAANFAEVWLAKEGHAGKVGINFLEKVQLPMLPSLYGALLAGVDYVLIGAGIPREIPGVLDRLARHHPASLRLHVEDVSPTDVFLLHFDPDQVVPVKLPPLKRPKFLAIIASSTLALALCKKANGSIEGFVVEGPTAGGHNAPPRGEPQLSATGEPIYGPRDEVDTEAIRALGLPFWLAGSYGDAQQLQRARHAGAAGVQVGTAFAFCRESGMDETLKAQILAQARRGEARIFTDPAASPAGFPFKVVQAAQTLSEPEVFAARAKVCDLGYLRHPYKKADGSLGYRCPAEPEEAYLSKGGKLEDTEGRKCLCNGLMATIGLAQRQRSGYLEPPLITAGDDVKHIARFLGKEATSYSAAEVIAQLLADGAGAAG